jgi:hypothetical protein
VEASLDLPDRCANCGTTLHGQYCHACGQSRFPADDLSVTRFFARFAHELAHLDFKSLRSLVALVRPGYLTAEYLAGRRRRYLSPLKLYFLAATVFFFAAPYVGFSLEDMTENDPSGGLKTMVDQRRAERGLEPGLFAERFDLRIQTVYTLSLSISVIAAALLLRLLYRKRTRLLGPHVVFALHYVSFLYLAAIALGGWFELVEWHDPRVTMPITYALLGPFLTLALRRVYRESWPRSVVKCLALLIEGNIVDSLVGLAALYLTLLLV